MKKKWKFPRVFEDFLVRSENLQLWVQIFIFFSFATSCFFMFLCFWWFSIVFHCFSWLSWISGATGKENEKKMIKKWKKKRKKKWKFPRVFEDFLVRSENLQLWVQIFIFFSFATSFFFHFPLFLMVFHCFSLFSMVFLDFRCHGKGKWKKNDKKMKFKMKKNEVWNEKKWCLKWKKMKFGETKNEKKMKKMKKKWKINEK